MTPEAIALAVLNAGRPAGIAAVYALLSTTRPKRLLLVYIVVGFAWSTTIGIVLISFFNEIEIGTGDSAVNHLVDVGAGVALLGFAGGLASGRVAADSSADTRPGPSRLEQRLHDPTLVAAGGAGVLTHLPGLFYVLGLNAILSSDPPVFGGMVQVVIFNLIWFATPTTALVISIRRPEATRRSLGRLTALGRRHGRTAVIALSAVVGTYFTVRGAVDLLS